MNLILIAGDSENKLVLEGVDFLNIYPIYFFPRGFLQPMPMPAAGVVGMISCLQKVFVPF